jgi:hypothetical protein
VDDAKLRNRIIIARGWLSTCFHSHGTEHDEKIMDRAFVLLFFVGGFMKELASGSSLEELLLRMTR